MDNMIATITDHDFSLLGVVQRIGLPQHCTRRSDREQTEWRESEIGHVCDSREFGRDARGAGSDWRG